jgi:hypothetical protein
VDNREIKRLRKETKKARRLQAEAKRARFEPKRLEVRRDEFQNYIQA